MAKNGQKVVKTPKKLEKIRGGRKKNFGEFFFDIFGKKNIFSRKISQIQPISRISSIFLKKSKNLKNLRKKSEKI